jgi:hypothetical protein
MERKTATPLTDRLLDQIEARLKPRGAKSAAALHVGISRQNLGRMLRERGVPRESEVLLKLEEFSRQLEAGTIQLRDEEPKDDHADASRSTEAPAELWIL